VYKWRHRRTRTRAIMVDDACAREAKHKFRVYPSARAGQFIAKCRRTDDAQMAAM
jgi:hypothetical protein